MERGEKKEVGEGSGKKRWGGDRGRRGENRENVFVCVREKEKGRKKEEKARE